MNIGYIAYIGPTRQPLALLVRVPFWSFGRVDRMDPVELRGRLDPSIKFWTYEHWLSFVRLTLDTLRHFILSQWE